MQKINFEQLQMEPFKFIQFKEYLEFKLNTNKPLSFIDFQKHCGISRQQWEIFKLNNKESFNNTEWLLE